MRGRKPTPTALKVLKGVRGDRINPNEPPTVQGRPECPEHLCEVARAEWDRMVPILETARVLSRTDGTALAIYCAAYARWVKATEKIVTADSLTELTAKGTPQVAPFVRIAAAAERDMARMLTEFGCTPSSRSRINVPDRKPADPLDRFRKKA